MATTTNTARAAARVQPVAGTDAVALREVLLDGRKLDADVTRRVVQAGPFVRTIDGASTFQLALADRDHVVQRSGLLEHAVDLVVPAADGTPLVFRLVADSSDEQGQLTLTFESRVWWDLASHDTPRVAPAGSNLARFALTMIREVKRAPIPFVCHQLQAEVGTVESGTRDAPDPETPEGRDRRREPGVADDARLTVKGQAASAQQRRVLAGCVAEARRLGASTNVCVAVVMCVTQESAAGSLANVRTGNDDVGIYQQGRNWIDVAGSKDPARSTRAFLETGPTSWRKVHGSLKTVPGGFESAIKRVQISVGGYQRWEAEARRTVEALGAGDAASIPADEPATSTAGDTRMRRGQDGSRETTTACLLRLAQERGWRFFESGGAIYLDPDMTLMRSRPRMTIRPQTEGLVVLPTHDRDVGKPVQTVSLTIRAGTWTAPPGSVVVLDGWGAAKDGRWLVGKITRDDLRLATLKIELVRAQAPKLPAAEASPTASTSSGGLGSLGAGSGGSGGGSSVDPRLERFYAEARSIDGRNMPYVWGGGHARAGQPTGGGFDCSGYVVACLAAAGLGFRDGGPSATSGGLMSWGKPGRGRYLTVYANAGHAFAELVVGSKRRWIDTSREAGGPAGPHVRTGDRPTAGFTARHWEGL